MSLFEDPSNIELSEEPLGPGATILRNFAISEETEILSGLSDVVSKAPFRHMITPGGFRMSVAMDKLRRSRLGDGQNRLSLRPYGP
jgi:DNA oxidative demethylase